MTPVSVRPAVLRTAAEFLANDPPVRQKPAQHRMRVDEEALGGGIARPLPALRRLDGSTDRDSPNRGAAYPIHLTQEFGSDHH
jgi:hypothetical protein